jgi:hypothetical protein
MDTDSLELKMSRLRAGDEARIERELDWLILAGIGFLLLVTLFLFLVAIDAQNEPVDETAIVTPNGASTFYDVYVLGARLFATFILVSMGFTFFLMAHESAKRSDQFKWWLLAAVFFTWPIGWSGIVGWVFGSPHASTVAFAAFRLSATVTAAGIQIAQLASTRGLKLRT